MRPGLRRFKLFRRNSAPPCFVDAHLLMMWEGSGKQSFYEILADELHYICSKYLSPSGTATRGGVRSQHHSPVGPPSQIAQTGVPESACASHIRNRSDPPQSHPIAPTLNARIKDAGGVGERLKPAVLKTVRPQKGLVGSNPTPSAIQSHLLRRQREMAESCCFRPIFAAIYLRL